MASLLKFLRATSWEATAPHWAARPIIAARKGFSASQETEFHDAQPWVCGNLPSYIAKRSAVAALLKFRTPSWSGITAPDRGVWLIMTVRRALRVQEERSLPFAQRKAPGVKSLMHAQK